MCALKLSSSSLYITYSLPSMAVSALAAPVAIIQGIYVIHYGFSLNTIAMIVLLARMFDAVSDPIIGYLSDRHYERTGDRKPFLVVGALLFGVSSYFLYVPDNIFWPDDAPEVSVVYFVFWFFAFYLAWTLYEIPHLSWAGDIAKTSDEKSRIFSFRIVAGYLGVVLFYLVPLVPYFDSQKITPQTLEVCAITFSALLLIFLSVSLKIPSRNSSRNKYLISHITGSQNNDLGNINLQSIIGNKPFCIFISAYLFTGIATGMWYGLIFIYVDAYLGLGDKFSKVFLLAFLIGIVATFFWYRLALKVGKRNTWIMAMLLSIASFVFTAELTPGQTSFSALVLLKTVQTLGFTCIGAMAPAMLSEIADYSTWKYGHQSTGMYFSLFTFVNKVNVAIGGALGLGIAGWYGFDVAAQSQTTESIFGLSLAISWLPSLFAFLALIFILLTPINSYRHTIIRRRLDIMDNRFNAMQQPINE